MAHTLRILGRVNKITYAWNTVSSQEMLCAIVIIATTLSTGLPRWLRR